MYRPQFAYPQPPSTCRDQNCFYSFDGSNTPSFVSVQANDPGTNKIPLTLDQDADFIIRAIRIPQTSLRVVLEDCFLHQLIDQNPANECLNPRFWSESDGAGLVVLESDNWGIWCPAGGSLVAYVQNPTNAPITGLVINIQGVKRYSGVRCN
jgi:hypothetical protein